MKKIQLFLILLSIIYTHATLLDLDIKSTIHFTKKLTDIDVLETNVNALKQKILSIAKIEKDLASHYMPKIDKKTAEVFKKISVQHAIDHEFDQMIEQQDTLFVSLADYFDIINSLFDGFTDRLNKTVNDETLCSLPWVDGIPEGTNLVHGLQSVQEMAFNRNFVTLFSNVMNSFNDENCLTSKMKYCDIYITLPNKLVAIYHLMSAIERKYFVMDSFVNLIKISCHNGVNAHNIITAREVLIRTIQGFLQSLKTTVANSERSLYVCDRTKYPEVTPNYIELEGFKRTVVLHKRAHSANNSCFLSCPNINDDSFTISDADFEARFQYCQGRLTDCKTGGNVEICRTPEGSSKLYQWIKSNDNGAVYGKKSDCLGEIEIMKSYKYEDYSSFDCEACICTCALETNRSQPRYGISLNEEVSDISNNKVVTGMKFVIVNNIIHVQIETGKVQSGNRIEEYSNKWKTINTVNIANNMIDIHDQLIKQEFIYFGSSFNDAQYINFEETVLNGQTVITGFKFTTIRKFLPHLNSEVNTISIALQATHYDIKSGRLGEYPSSWITFDPTKHDNFCHRYSHRRELRFPESDNPLNYDKVYINSINGDYATFWASNLEKDVGQTTVPFFDANPVFGTPRFPLGVAGLYHKGPLNSGGYISLNIGSIDFSALIDVNIPAEDKADLDIILSGAN